MMTVRSGLKILFKSQVWFNSSVKLVCLSRLLTDTIHFGSVFVFRKGSVTRQTRTLTMETEFANGT